MDDIDNMLDEFDKIYAKAESESSSQRNKNTPQEEEELAVMDFMIGTPSLNNRAASMESNDNLDDEINKFMSKTGNSSSATKKKKAARTVGATPEYHAEEFLASDEQAVEDELDWERGGARDQDPAVDADCDGPAADGDGRDAEDQYEDEDPDMMGGDGGPESASADRKRPYETEMTRPVVSFGGTKLTYGEAKLYGLLDENGKVKLRLDHEKFSRSREAVLHSRALAERKEPYLKGPTEEDKEMTFKPTRSKDAEKAMRAKGCGYDFVNRLDEGGDFLQRAFSKGEKGKSEKRLLESQKEDYDARLDKLKCPKCNKFQSFDEFIENKRSCQQCRERYVKSSVSHPQAYARKQEEAERRRLERLKRIEDEVYPPLPKTRGHTGGKSLIERTNELMVAQKEQARLELEAKKRAEIEALAKARAPPRPVTQPVNIPLAEGKPPRSSSQKMNATSGDEKKSSIGNKKLKAAVKHSIISEKFNKLIQYPKDIA